MTRKLWLRNSASETVDLNGSVFFSSPQGLGYQVSPKYSDHKHGFFRNVESSEEPQGDVVGDIVFVSDDPYAQYDSFVNWISGSAELELAYQPKDIAYYRKVELTSISKSEIERSGILRCPVTFTCLTPWYKNIPTTMHISESSSGNVSRYPARYDFRYVAGSTNQSIEVSSAGQLESAIVLEITGAFTNPIITLSDLVTGEEIGKAIVEYFIPAGETMVWSTLPNDSYISVGAIDLIEYTDITYNVFPCIPLNRPCSLSIAGDNSLTSAAVVKKYDYYRSV